jgi:hypothetical protein
LIGKAEILNGGAIPGELQIMLALFDTRDE